MTGSDNAGERPSRPAMLPTPTGSHGIDPLIEASSLGTSAARSLRNRTSKQRAEELVTAAFPSEGSGSVQRSHLLSDTVVAFVDGGLAEDARDQAASHIAGCLTCAAEVDAQRQARAAVTRTQRRPNTHDTEPAAHRTIFLLDVEGFSRRTNKNQIVVREGLKNALQMAFDIAGTACRAEDRGDGVFMVALAEMPKAPFVDAMPATLAAVLQEHNAIHRKEEQIRLRMALHAGNIELDENGSAGAAIMHAFRLMRSQAAKEALASSPGVLALIASDWFYSEVIRHSSVVTYQQVPISVKETSTRAWISLPDHPALWRTSATPRTASRPRTKGRGLRRIVSGTRGSAEETGPGRPV